MECYFPIDKIERGISVAVWGYGTLGKYLIEWNEKFKYCNIVCVFEQNQGSERLCDIEISKIEKWKNYRFDKMIITMTCNLTDIKKQIIAQGISIDICIFLAEGNYINYNQSSKISYSQEGEDIILCNLLKRLGKTEISYCDIGANDPVHLNNTYLIERDFKVKKGVLVEPNPILADKISKERKKSICINCGVTDSPQIGNLKFYIMECSTLSSFSREEIQGYEQQGYKVEREESIICVNINNILEEHFNEGIDVISIDTEGYDLKIIEAINYEKYRPVIICVETCGFNTGKDQDGLNIINRLIEKGYIVYADTFINTIFVDKEIMERYFSRDMKTIYPFLSK